MNESIFWQHLQKLGYFLFQHLATLYLEHNRIPNEYQKCKKLGLTSVPRLEFRKTPNCDCFHDLKKSFLLCPISIFFFVATSYCPESRRIEEAAIDLRTSDEMMMMTTTTIDIGGGSKEKVKKSQFKVSQFVSLRLYMTQYTYHLATPGSNPKHTIYAFLI